MEQLIVALIGGLLAMFGYGAFQKKKRSNAEALASTIDIKNEQGKLDGKKLPDSGEADREELKKQLEAKMKDVLTSEELAKFFEQYFKDGK